MPEAFYPTTPFPIDHIIARQHGGLPPRLVIRYGSFFGE